MNQPYCFGMIKKDYSRHYDFLNPYPLLFFHRLYCHVNSLTVRLNLFDKT